MGLLYMATRLIVNMTQVYLPMYVSDSAQLDKVIKFKFLSWFIPSIFFETKYYNISLQSPWFLLFVIYLDLYQHFHYVLWANTAELMWII